MAGGNVTSLDRRGRPSSQAGILNRPTHSAFPIGHTPSVPRPASLNQVVAEAFANRVHRAIDDAILARLFEQSHLRGTIARAHDLAGADTDQTDATIQRETREECKREARDLFVGVDGLLYGDLSRVRFERLIPKLQGDLARAVIFPAETAADAFRQSANCLYQQFAVPRVFLKRGFVADGLRFPVRDDGAFVVAPGEFIKVYAEA